MKIERFLLHIIGLYVIGLYSCILPNTDLWMTGSCPSKLLWSWVEVASAKNYPISSQRRAGGPRYPSHYFSPTFSGNSYKKSDFDFHVEPKILSSLAFSETSINHSSKQLDVPKRECMEVYLVFVLKVWHSPLRDDEPFAILSCSYSEALQQEVRNLNLCKIVIYCFKISIHKDKESTRNTKFKRDNNSKPRR